MTSEAVKTYKGLRTSARVSLSVKSAISSLGSHANFFTCVYQEYITSFKSFKIQNICKKKYNSTFVMGGIYG